MHVSQASLILVALGSLAAFTSLCASLIYVVVQGRPSKNLRTVPSPQVKAKLQAAETIYVSIVGKRLEIKGTHQDIQSLRGKLKNPQKIQVLHGPLANDNRNVVPIRPPVKIKSSVVRGSRRKKVTYS